MNYLILRNKTYHFRYKIPERFRAYYPKSEIKRSLKTDSFSAAMALIARKIPQINALNFIYKVTDEAISLLNTLADFSGIFSPLNFQPQPTVQATVSSEAQTEAIRSIRPVHRLSKCWTSFVEWKNWNDKVRSGAERYYEFMLAVWGDKDVQKITKRDIKHLLNVYAKTPRRNLKQYKRLSQLELVALENVPEEHKVSPKMVKELLKLCQSFFSSYLTKEEDILDKSPTLNVKYEAEVKRFAALSDKEVVTIMEESKKLVAWKRWVFLLAVYTGARRSEIAGLTASDVRQDEESGRYYLVIQKGKTSAAKRSIPLHKKLIDLGFIEYVKAQGVELFPAIYGRPEAFYDVAVSLFNKLGIPSVNDDGERKVFHSFRHTFITKARSKGTELGLLQAVVGHEQSQAGITQKYTHGYPLSELWGVVDCVSY